MSNSIQHGIINRSDHVEQEGTKDRNTKDTPTEVVLMVSISINQTVITRTDGSGPHGNKHKPDGKHKPKGRTDGSGPHGNSIRR